MIAVVKARGLVGFLDLLREIEVKVREGLGCE